MLYLGRDHPAQEPSPYNLSLPAYIIKPGGTEPSPDYLSLPRLLSSSPGERNRAFIVYPGGANLLSIPGERNYAFIIHPGGADHNHTLHG